MSRAGASNARRARRRRQMQEAEAMASDGKRVVIESEVTLGSPTPREMADGLTEAISGRRKSVMRIEAAYPIPDEIVLNGRRYVPAREE